MDLRYQDAKLPWGYYGKKQGILLRSPDKPDHVPDWDFYDGHDRYEISDREVIDKTVSEKRGLFFVLELFSKLEPLA